ncbi:hypothetical protein WJX73_005830 [Symbiochloris irregularis]|uniref:Regulatory protein RecX n=1 Tax=Symbiochloris irregularis TaxID=706552 RepID=A0AAW1PJK1_9CHLO
MYSATQSNLRSREDISPHTPSQRKDRAAESGVEKTQVPEVVSADTFAALNGGALRAPKLSRKELRRQKSLQACKDLTFFLLSRRMHSRHELHTKLTRKERFDPDIIEEALDRLQELESIDDAEFARQYALSKSQYAYWAPSRIKLGLRTLGVNDADICKGLDALLEAEIDTESSQAGSLLLDAAQYGVDIFTAVTQSSTGQGQHPLVAGGGGKKSSGIANRLVALQLSGEELDDEPASQLVTDDAAVRMVLGQAGTRLIVVLGRGGLQAVDILRADGQGPKLTPFSGELATQLRQFGLVKCIAFGNSTNQLAIGGEDRSLRLLEWPSLRTKWDLRNEFGLKDALRDIDFSPGHKDKVLVTTCEDGTCTLWQTDTGMRITSLSLPADLPRGASFNRAKFSRGAGLHLFTSVNAGGDGYVLRWEQDTQGIVVLTKQAKAHNSPITAFDISPSGRFLGTGTSEGDIARYAPQRFTFWNGRP